MTVTDMTVSVSWKYITQWYYCHWYSSITVTDMQVSPTSTWQCHSHWHNSVTDDDQCGHVTWDPVTWLGLSDAGVTVAPAVINLHDRRTSDITLSTKQRRTASEENSRPVEGASIAAYRHDRSSQAPGEFRWKQLAKLRIASGWRYYCVRRLPWTTNCLVELLIGGSHPHCCHNTGRHITSSATCQHTWWL